MKTMSRETKIKKIISMINAGKTWEECSELLGNSVYYSQKMVREYYKTPTRYNNLLRKARENKKLKKESIPVVDADEVIGKEVFLVETGYLLKSDTSVLTQEDIPVYIPVFCVSELTKMANDNKTAEEIISIITASNSIQQIELKGIENFYIPRPSFEYKSRSRGIAAVAKYLSECYWNVKVWTNSYEVVKILEEQKSDNIDVILTS